MKTTPFSKKKVISLVSLVFFAFSLTSCGEGSGCIYADEFGDSNRASFSLFPYNKYLCESSETNENEYMKNCMNGNEGDITFNNALDGSLVTIQASNGGCLGESNALNRQSCIERCSEQCVEVNTGEKLKPTWYSLYYDIDSKDMSDDSINRIQIFASGRVVFDENEDIEEFNITRNNSNLQYQSVDNNNLILREGVERSLVLTGAWPESKNCDNVDCASEVSKSTIVYLKDLPSDFDMTQDLTSQQDLLFADEGQWSCKYAGNDLLQNVCSTTQDSFLIDSFSLGSYGGMLVNAQNSNSDQYLRKMHYPDYNNASCYYDNISSEYKCDWVNSSLDEVSYMLNGSMNITPSAVPYLIDGEKYSLSFKIIGSDSRQAVSSNTSNPGSCGFNVNIGGVNRLIELQPSTNTNDSGWYYLEDMVFDRNLPYINIGVPVGTWNDGVNDINCAAGSVAVRFDKVKRIIFNNSGFVKFRILGNSSDSCTINARLVNPGLSMDDLGYYEYGDEDNSAASKFLFNNINVTANAWQNMGSDTEIDVDTNSERLYARNDQELWFLPSSWDGYWENSDGLARECGIGMAIKIDERPAVFCDSFMIYEPNSCAPAKDNNGDYTGFCGIESYESCLSDDNLCRMPDLINQGSNVELIEEYCHSSTGIQDTNSSEFLSCTSQCNACYTHLLDVQAEKVIPFVNNQLEHRFCYNLENYSGSRLRMNLSDSLPGYPVANAEGVYTNTTEVKNFVSIVADLYNETGALTAEELNDGALFVQSISDTSGDIGYIGNLLRTTNADGNFNIINGSYELQGATTITRNRDQLMTFFIPDGYTDSGSYIAALKGTQYFLNGQYVNIRVCYDKDMSKCINNDAIPLIFQQSGGMIVEKNADIDDGECRFDSNGIMRCEKDGEWLDYYSFDKSYFCNQNNSKLTGCDGVESDECNLSIQECKNKISLYFQIEEEGGSANYIDNSGSYRIQVEQTAVDSDAGAIANIVDDIFNITVDEIEGYVELMYNGLVQSNLYQNLLNLCMVLFLMFYGFNYLMGTAQFTQSELLNRLTKIAFIYFFVSPNGWDMYNAYFVTFFRNGIDYIVFSMAAVFGNIQAELEIQQGIENRGVLFNGLSDLWGLIFNTATFAKITGLLFSSLTGWVSVILLVMALMSFIFASASAILLYVMSHIMIVILLMLGPIFFITLLFSQTRSMFDKWLKALIGFAMQQIILFTALSLFFVIFEEFIKIVLGFTVCMKDIWSIPIVNTTILRSYSIPATSASDVLNNSAAPSMLKMLSLYLVASLMKKYVNFVVQMSDAIAGAPISTSSLAGSVGGDIRKAWARRGKAVDNVIGGATRLIGRRDTLGTRMIKGRQEYLNVDKWKSKVKETLLGKELNDVQKADIAKKVSQQKKLINASQRGMQEFTEKNPELTGKEFIEGVRQSGEKAFATKAKSMGLKQNEAEALKQNLDISGLGWSKGVIGSGETRGFDDAVTNQLFSERNLGRFDSEDMEGILATTKEGSIGRAPHRGLGEKILLAGTKGHTSSKLGGAGRILTASRLRRKMAGDTAVAAHESSMKKDTSGGTIKDFGARQDTIKKQQRYQELREKKHGKGLESFEKQERKDLKKDLSRAQRKETRLDNGVDLEGRLQQEQQKYRSAIKKKLGERE